MIEPVRRRAWRPGAALSVALVVLLLSLGCLGPRQPEWAASVTDFQLAQALADLPDEAVSGLVPLSEIFYQRITSRRFNSRATFEDPSVREFFPSVAAYSDYYAALVDDLDRAFIEFNRPTSVKLLSVERMENGSLGLELRFVGENDLPLRWWSADLVRTDEWVWRDGRWWIVPGKV